MLDTLGGSDPRRRKALGGCQAAQSGVATTQKLFFPRSSPNAPSPVMSFLLLGLNPRTMENWPQMQTKDDSRALFALEASFCAVRQNARIRPKSLKQNHLVDHEPGT